MLCERCGRRYIFDWRRGHTRQRCNSCRSNAADRLARKERMVAYKGGRCQICGYAKCLRALEFHHIDPETKEFNIAGSHLRRWDVVQAELEKCILVCANCHAEIDDGVTQIPPDVAAPVLSAIVDVPRRPRQEPGRPRLS